MSGRTKASETPGQIARRERNESIIAAYLAGATAKEAGEPYGLTGQRVSQILKADGCSPSKEEWRARQAAATKAAAGRKAAAGVNIPLRHDSAAFLTTNEGV